MNKVQQVMGVVKANATSLKNSMKGANPFGLSQFKSKLGPRTSKVVAKGLVAGQNRSK